MKIIDQTMRASKASAEAPESTKSETKRLQMMTAELKENEELLNMRISINNQEIAKLKDNKPKYQAEIAALRKEKSDGWEIRQHYSVDTMRGTRC
ncbi:hypothetical protein BPOR_0258g00100 [Botrytis porri]|uniref:Uncharacterized protein n=1 Tax=Botrytis porri TaxID=87229 RepID=A0A4Z1KLS0_9HELO|nr:hypothetical protein BPOR_0258g00100 [Botrytis porri]